MPTNVGAAPWKGLLGRGCAGCGACAWLLTLLTAGCNAVFGIGDLSYGPTNDGGGAGASPCLIPLSDDFEAAAVDHSVWAEGHQDAQEAVSDGRFVVTPSSAVIPTLGEIRSIALTDLRGCAVFVELPQALSPSGDATTVFVVMTPDSVGWTGTAGFRVSYGLLHANVVPVSGDQGSAQTDYDAVVHRWLRIREAGGSLFMETSDGSSPWASLLVWPSPDWISQVRVQLAGGSFAEIAPNPGQAEFDNVNVPPANPPP
jgi:hypothetical protein